MIGIRSNVLVAAAVAAVGLMAAGSASAALNGYKPPNYTFPSGFQGFKLLSHGGDFNPGVLVGFNPQPEPPGNTVDFNPQPDPPATLITLLNPINPVLNNPANGGAFNFLIALLDVGDGSVLPAVQAPNPDGFTGFSTDVAGHHISMSLQFGGSPVTSWSWGAFNPQPDPPGDWGGGAIGFAADPFMGFHMIVDDHLETFTLAGAPEPGTWGLMLAGFFGAGMALRARRAAKLAA